MSELYTVCPYCQAGNPASAAVCWMCRSALGPATAGATAPMPASPSTSVAAATKPDAIAPTLAPMRPPSLHAWSATLVVSVLLSLAIAAELARVAPGILVLFLFVDLPVVGALLFTVVKMWGGDRSDGDRGAARSFAERAVTGVAIGLGGLFSLLALLFLFALAIFVIAFMICLAMIAASSLH